MDDFDQLPLTDPVVDAYAAGIDVTLLKRNLQLSVDERILRLMQLQKLADEVRRAGREAGF